MSDERQMSELGFASWLSDRFNYGYIGLLPAPKKLTWIQKIRDYDYQKNMADYYRSMYDTWRSIGHEKSRELKLMEKVADNWQQKAIDANKEADRILDDYSNFVDEIEKEILADNINIGKRLKFSVGHNHIEIVIGNPVTACKLFNEVDGLYFDSFSLCNSKDQYNWKQGAIQSLVNLIDKWFIPNEINRAEWFNKLFKKYPELKTK